MLLCNCMISLIASLSIFLFCSAYQFSLYDTNRFDNALQYDCLYYYVLDDIVTYEESFTPHHQIIPYCIRPHSGSENVEFFEYESSTSNRITFEEMGKANVTSEQLWIWSASIDIIELYQIYLNNRSSTSTSHQLYYNCTPPWFGFTCQYAFILDESLNNIVKMTFNSSGKETTNGTCYTHLLCDRGHPPFCLDWREICNGKIDCADYGQDEEGCFELEINECTVDEYRCHNGQCIPKDFVHDSLLNPDCLDRTDEFVVYDYPKKCFADPTFRCEEHSCRPGQYEFSCGDGNCVWKSGSCTNGRHQQMQQAMVIMPNETCSVAMKCATRIFGPCSNEQLQSDTAIHEICPSTFQFPNSPVALGHIRLIYSNHQSYTKSDCILLPDYVCYSEQLCDEFLSDTIVTVSINGSICRHLEDLNVTNDTCTSWVDFIEFLEIRFAELCLSIPRTGNDTHCYDQSLYHCQNSSRCISKHRLVDGIHDCHLKDDELYAGSCLLNDTYRFQCSNKCISPIQVHDTNDDCVDYDDDDDLDLQGKDEKKQEPIIFQQICDGFLDQTDYLHNVDYENDETNCLHWPCNNTYTRCDHYWNCQDGADEVNCPPSTCPLFEHMCVSPITYNLTCLPINQTADGIIDCLGASDERYMCRADLPAFKNWRFRCKDGECLDVADIMCNNDKDCEDNDDEAVCSNTSTFSSPICNSESDDIRSPTQNFLCQLTDAGKPKIIFFTVRNLPIYPEIVHSMFTQTNLTHHNHPQEHTFVVKKIDHRLSADTLRRCNRGLLIRHLLRGMKCLCPPSYYGDQCQYQNQRVSLTMQLRAESDWRRTFAIVIMLITDDEQYTIESYDQITYLPIRTCDTKFNLNLLYSSRPKNLTKNYSIRIDAYDKHLLIHRSSWLFPIKFPFLPVYRLSIQLTIPATILLSIKCKLACYHGQCTSYMNAEKHFCRCDRGWSGKECNVTYQCQCSYNAICIHNSICVCPLNSWAPHCNLMHSSCQSNPCKNGGQCVPNDEFTPLNFTCICPENYSGVRCELATTQIDIHFHHQFTIPSAIFAHFIAVHQNGPPVRWTILRKIPFDSQSISIYTSNPFHLIFLEFAKEYYLIVLQKFHVLMMSISTTVIPGNRCLHIRHLLNSTIVKLHLTRRVKYYPLICQHNTRLVCFHDETYMCLCDLHRHVNCLDFEHNITYDCNGRQLCQNGGHCFQDHPSCPTMATCVCPDCFYGTKCQFSTKGFGLSLDAILGYQIRPRLAFKHQSLAIKLSTAIVITIVTFGLVSGTLSTMTFMTKNLQEVGCGIYLLANAIVSLLTMLFLMLKFLLFVLSQQAIITNRTALILHCKTADFLLRTLCNTGEWLRASVAVERALTVLMGIHFDKTKSRWMTRRVIAGIVFSTIVSTIHDPIYRQLIDDQDEERTWCVVTYNDGLRLYNSIILIFHSLIPFAINIISALVIIFQVARRRSLARKQKTFREHLHAQFRQYKHMIISPCILALLTSPHLILSFVSGCMKSARDPWLFLVSYFIPFSPSVLTLIIFVLPSDIYTKELMKNIRRYSSLSG